MKPEQEHHSKKMLFLAESKTVLAVIASHLLENILREENPTLYVILT